MSALDAERLRAIKTLPQLLAYLRNDLDWPIEIEDVEDLTFDYQPGELGLDAVLRDFNNRNPLEDPVIHFYQDFLNEYDKQRRIQRGVFYTPQPVVSYIVRSVHELLQTEFGLEDGLASTSPDEPFVVILDTATGTTTFLVEVIDVIHKTMVAKWSKLGKSKQETLF